MASPRPSLSLSILSTSPLLVVLVRLHLPVSLIKHIKKAAVSRQFSSAFHSAHPQPVLLGLYFLKPLIIGSSKGQSFRLEESPTPSTSCRHLLVRQS
ncbi:hypothetical protein BDR05DRAFT_620118 [Suillus weaverae]|nr:hypothetical protein BDR05DRAFT_620118 [Suillus weaverae]